MFFLVFSVLRFSFVRLCTTNFSGFWFFWMAFSYTSVVHKYHLQTYSVRSKASFGLSRQEHSVPPWWQPSALTIFVLSLSSSMSHLSVWVCSGLYWLSSMRAVQGRGGHPIGHLSCDVSMLTDTKVWIYSACCIWWYLISLWFHSVRRWIVYMAYLQSFVFYGVFCSFLILIIPLLLLIPQMKSTLPQNHNPGGPDGRLAPKQP